MKLRKLIVPFLAAVSAAAMLGACGGSGGSAETAAATTAAASTAAETAKETEKATEAETKAEIEVETKAEETEAAEVTKAAPAASGDVGKWTIYEYEANGNKVSHDMLVTAGMGDTYLELYEDGTGKFNLFQSLLDITWKPGEITVYGTSKYTYEIDGDTLNMDMQGVYYTMVRDGSAGSGASSGSSTGAKDASVEPYINDGTIEGVYRLWNMMGMSLSEWAEIMGCSLEQAADSMRVEIVDEKTARVSFDTEEEMQEVGLSMDGDQITLSVEDETLGGTLKDGILTLDIEGEQVILARLTDAAFAGGGASAALADKGEAAVWNGQYTKFVGDDDSARNTDDKFTLELYEDGTGVHHRDDLDINVTWELDGDKFTMKETFMGMNIDYTGTMKGDELSIFNGDPEDDFTCEYVYLKEGGSSSASSGSASSGSSASSRSSAPAGVPGGDGLMSEEEVQKGYVWMNKVAKDIFHTTYEELAEHFGVEGKFDKEEYSEHMKVNKRYYFWISKEDKNHFIYVNFEEDDPDGAPGVYTVSGFNSSGFSASEAEAKYLDEVKAEATEADKAAAANMAMKDFSVDIHPFAHDEVTLSVSAQIPESGWAYDEKKDHLVENEDVNTFGAGFIQFKLDQDVEKFDFYKDKFENYQEIEDRDFDGVTFKGRTYKNIGYEWTEYIAQIDDERALSIGIVRVDISEGTVGDKILNSIKLK